MHFLRFFLILSFLYIAACASKDIPAENTTFTKNELIDVRVPWIKNEGDNYDLRLMIFNLTEKTILIDINDIACFKGDLRGILKHTFFNTGEREIDFRPGQTQAMNMICDLGTKTDGLYKITIKKIYESAKVDVDTKGKLLGGPVEWTGRHK